MTRKLSKGLILFVLVLIIPYLQACNAQTQEEEIGTEEQLHADLKQWMDPLRDKDRREWVEDIDLSNQSATLIRQYPLFERMDEFYQANQSRYRQVRLESLHRYHPAPAELPGYEPLDMLSDSDMAYDIDLIQDLSNARTFDAGETQTVLNMMSNDIIDRIKEERELTWEQLAIGMAPGFLLFADQLQDEDNWKLTYVGRLYAVQFHWNILTNRLSNMEVKVYRGDGQKPGWLKDGHFNGNTPRLKLLSDIQAFLWSSYDRSPKLSIDDKEVLEKSFIAKHRDEYTQVRKSILRQLPDIDDTWRTSYRASAELNEDPLVYSALGDLDVEGRLPAHISLGEIGYNQVLNSFHLSLQVMQQKYNKMAQMGFLFSWFVGDKVHAREVRENVWDIVGFIDDYALYYRWNIATDEVEEISCWQKTGIKKE